MGGLLFNILKMLSGKKTPFNIFLLSILILLILKRASLSYPISLPESSAKEILQRTIRKISTIHNYRCKLTSTSILGDISEKQVFNYYFKSPGFRRIEVIEGKDKGSILVYRDGIVRARKRGLFSFITLTFRPEDKRVTTIRRGRIDQTDFQFILSLLLEPERKIFWKKKDIFQDEAVDVLELVDTREANANSYDEPVKGLFWISQESDLILKYELYNKSNNLVFRQINQDIQVNIDIPEDFFKL